MTVVVQGGERREGGRGGERVRECYVGGDCCGTGSGLRVVRSEVCRFHDKLGVKVRGVSVRVNSGFVGRSDLPHLQLQREMEGEGHLEVKGSHGNARLLTSSQSMVL